MSLKGFDKSYYLSAKLAALQATYTEWATKTTTDLETYLTNVGYTAEAHYQAFGWTEGLRPNAYFNASEYKTYKGKALFDSGYSVSIAAGIAAFTAAWTADPYLHYITYGAFESGVNPSNSFDQNAYYTAKLAALQANTATQADWTGKTVADLRTYFQGVGINPIQHYLAVGTAESLTVSAVTATAQVSTTATGSTNPGSTFTLTSGTDQVNGTSGDDTITGALGSLGTVDEIHGSAGNDTLTVSFDPGLATAASASAAAPIIDGVETINLNARNSAATFGFSNVSGVTAINVGGNANLTLSAMPASLSAVGVNAFSAVLTIEQATATASTAAYGLTLNLSASSATDIVYSEDTGNTALADTLTLNALGNVGASGRHSSAMDFSGIEQLVLKGPGNVDLDLSCATWANYFNDLTAIKASALSGNMTIFVDGGDLNIVGGAGADTLIMSANLNNNDTIDGGAGTDAIHAQVSATFRPNLSNVESLTLRMNETGLCADFLSAAGIGSLDLYLVTASNVMCSVYTAMTAININSSNSTANNLTVNYHTAAAASDVNLTLGIGTSVLETTQQTATGLTMGIGTLTMSGNSGSLNVKVDASANYTANGFILKDFTAVTINAASGNLAIANGGLDFSGAQTLSLNAAADHSIAVSAGVDITANQATTITLAASGGNTATGILTLAGTAKFYASAGTINLNVGASGLMDLSAVVMCSIDTMNISVGASGAFSANAVLLGHDGSTAGSGALGLNTFTLSAAGDVSIAAFGYNTAADTAATSVALTFNVSMASTSVDVGLSGVNFDNVAQVATASEQDITFNVSGSGNFTLSAVAVSSNVTWHIAATALASACTLAVSLGSITDTNSIASAKLGAASGTYSGMAGVDTIEFGAGAMTVDGGLGNDQISFNSSTNYYHMTMDTIAGVDSITNAGANTGDVILFGAAHTGTGHLGSGTANTGASTHTSNFWTQSFSAMGTTVITTTADTNTAMAQIAVYTAGSDTIIQVLGSTAAFGITATAVATAGPQSASDDYVTIVLKNYTKDVANTGITSMFKLDSTGTGLQITLL